MLQKSTAADPEPWSAFVPLLKFDEKTGIGVGVMAEEAIDKAAEIFDYDGSKPYVLDWSKMIEKASDGKSVGNVRAMHGKSAAGKLTKINPNDVSKQFEVEFKVVDPVDRAKCAEGVYTGLSIGGAYVKKWDDPVIKGVTRYIAKPSEVSLVDNPCMYGATFTYTKADGAQELRKFVGGIESEAEPVQVWRCLTKGHEHIRKSEAAHCIADGVAKGDSAEAVSKALTSGDLKKCLWQVAQLAEAIMRVRWVQEAEAYESAMEEDSSATPAILEGIVEQLHEALIQMAEEEAAEYSADGEDDGDALAMAMRVTLKKAISDPRLAKAVSGEEKTMEKPKTDPNAPAAAVAKTEVPADLAKSIEDKLAALEKLKTDTADELKKRDEAIEKLSKTSETQTELLKLLVAAMPERAKVALRVVTKSDDGGAAGEKSDDDLRKEYEAKGDALGLMKLALRNGATTPAAFNR